MFRAIINALNDTFPEKQLEAERLKLLIRSFEFIDGILYYEGKICAPQQNNRELLSLVHDSPLGGHFGFSKTLSRLDTFHWHKNSNIKQYSHPCATCRQ